jgi:hypothetical protein
MEQVGRRTLLQVLEGTADVNIRLADLRKLLLSLGFTERVKGSHHISTKPEVAEILNLQPRGALLSVSCVKAEQRRECQPRRGLGFSSRTGWTLLPVAGS